MDGGGTWDEWRRLQTYPEAEPMSAQGPMQVAHQTAWLDWHQLHGPSSPLQLWHATDVPAGRRQGNTFDKCSMSARRR